MNRPHLHAIIAVGRKSRTSGNPELLLVTLPKPSHAWWRMAVLPGILESIKIVTDRIAAYNHAARFGWKKEEQ
jgi:hypothetical protein